MKFPRWLQIVVWATIVALGVGAVAVLAWSRGEPGSALWMVVAAVCVFSVSYRFHSAWLMAEVLTLDELRATPAEVHEDGRDFVRTNKWVVFGHHFGAAIAGPGPLVGPVAYAAQFGFLPGMLWMLVGATLGGAVHDCMIMFCSVRRNGKSLAQMVREEVGPFAGVAALVSIISIMIILLAVLGLVVVNALAESPWGLFTIAATMPIAVAMGCAMRYGASGGKWLAGISVFGVARLAGGSMGRAIHPWNGAGGLVDLARYDARVVDHGLWFAGVGFAGMAAAGAARLPEHFHENRYGGRAGGGDHGDWKSMLKMPSLTKFIDGTGPVVAGAGVPLLLHHHRVRGDFRIFTR